MNVEEIRWTAKGMSNYHRIIDEGFEDDLRAGMRGTHTAWDFNGQVRFDPETQVFTEEVWVHHRKVATVTAASLPELMSKISEEYGWD
jgi:hypothetical protein